MYAIRSYYVFARGDEVKSSSGQPVKLSRPLDFLVVADHSDNMGFVPDLVSGKENLRADPQGRKWYEMILGWYNPGKMPEYHRQISQPLSSETLQPFASLAARHGIHLCFGISELDGESLVITSYSIHYTKLYDAAILSVRSYLRIVGRL